MHAFHLDRLLFPLADLELLSQLRQILIGAHGLIPLTGFSPSRSLARKTKEHPLSVIEWTDNRGG